MTIAKLSTYGVISLRIQMYLKVNILIKIPSFATNSFELQQMNRIVLYNTKIYANYLKCNKIVISFKFMSDFVF